ncbi:MAG: hypothetical protein EOP34_08655 [Rickettsiales bacterium]|nr:MAG: hypothetical protein EOP34_08655 [Rickettsiales bacterium]
MYNTYNYNFPSDSEYMANTNILNIASNGAECISPLGSIPTKTLNLPKEYMLDSWGNKINLHVSNILCSNNYIITGGSCNQQSYDENAANMNVKDLQTGINVNNVAYVIISHGANGYGAYSKSGKSTAAKFSSTAESNSTPEVVNRSSKVVSDLYYNQYYDTNISSVTDDIILFSTKSQIRSHKNIPSIPAITSVDCNTNSQNLEYMDSSKIQNIRNNLVITKKYAQNSSYNNGDEAVLDMMWVLQEACYEIYKTTRKCPLGGTYNLLTNDCSI